MDTEGVAERLARRLTFAPRTPSPPFRPPPPRRSLQELSYARSKHRPVVMAVGADLSQSKSGWLSKALAASPDDLNFVSDISFQASLALLMLKLNAHHVSDQARETSTIGVTGKVPDVSWAETLLHLEQGMDDPKACRSALRLLLSFALEDELKPQMLDAKAVELVARAVGQHPGSDEVALCACWMVNHLAYGAEELCPNITRQGGTEMVAACMRAHSGNAGVQLQGCAALQRLVVSDAVADAGAVDLILAAQAAHPSNGGVQLNAIRALMALQLSDKLSAAAQAKARGRVSIAMCDGWLKTFPPGTLCHDAAVSFHALLSVPAS